MQTVAGFVQVLITQWIWAFSWGWHQIALSIIFLTVSLRCICQWSFISSVVLALFSQISAFVLFGLFVYGVLFLWLGYTYDPNLVVAYGPLQVGIQLALIFTVLQSIVLWFFTRSYPIPLYQIVAVVCVSNMLGAFLAARALMPA